MLSGGEGHRPRCPCRQKLGVPQERGCPFPGDGVFAPPSPFFKNVLCVRETEILVEQQPPQGVFVCDHVGLVINKLSHIDALSCLLVCHLGYPWLELS